MDKIIIIIAILLSIFAVFGLIKLHFNNAFLKKVFERGNVLVAGRKRKGKDLLFAHVIKLRKKNHYANIPYDLHTKKYKTDIRDLAVLNCGENNYLKLIVGNIKKFEPTLELKKDFYISDAGIYLPSQYDCQLSKIFQGMPITYALSGHLYESNIHCNSQRFNRVWIKLREQADHFILVKSNLKTPFGAFLNLIYYDRYETAENEKLPFKSSFLSSDRRKVEKENFECSNGIVKRVIVFVPWRTAKNYDTHGLRKEFFLDATIFDKK